MIRFQRKGARSSNWKYAGTPVLLVDAKPEEGKASGFGLNKDAVELLGLKLTGEEYLAFQVEGQRVFATVSQGELAKSFRVGKTYTTIDGARVVRGNHKPTWEYLAATPLVTDNGAVLQFVKAEEEADVEGEVFELVNYYSQAPDSPIAQEEAEQADWADAQEVTQDTTPEFGY